MKQIEISQTGNDTLLLFFGGWGVDAHPFESLKPADRDFMLCYDYRNLNFDTHRLASYQKVEVIAWSLGVWVASQVLPVSGLPVIHSIAVNGTLSPIHRETGIPDEIFQGTIDHLNERNLMKFQRRMCYESAVYEAYRQMAPQRSVEEVKEELIALQHFILGSRNPQEISGNLSLDPNSEGIVLEGERENQGFDRLKENQKVEGEKKNQSSVPLNSWSWNEVYISENDAIFPFQNQQRAWQGKANLHTVKEGHYCPQLFKALINHDQ